MAEKAMSRIKEVAANQNVKEKEYWLRQLQGVIDKSRFPYDYLNHPSDKRQISRTGFEVPAPLVSRLNKISGASDFRLHMILAAAVTALLAKYSGSSDIVIGMPIYRQEEEGEYINTVLALRNHLHRGISFKELLVQVKDTVFAAVEHQNYPIEALLYHLNMTGRDGGFPLFDVAVLLRNIQDAEYLSHVPYHMLFTFERAGGVLEGVVHYNTLLYKDGTVSRLIGHFKQLLQQVLESLDLELERLELITPAEKQQLLEGFNDTAADYPRDKTLPQLFWEQVSGNPDRTALVYAGQCVTYRSLADAAHRLASFLTGEKNIEPDHRVGLLMNKSILCLGAILGILKAGAAYVPIDTAMPEERVKHIINEAGIRVVISEKRYIRTLNRLQWECPGFHSFLCLDSLDVYAEEEVEKSGLMDKKLWEYVGERATDDITGGGWFSSYDGTPLSAEIMAEYGENVEKKLEPLLHPQMRVLEIGCATGLTMYRIAPGVGLYWGVDLSPVIIEKNKKRVSAEQLHHIRLQTMPAHDIHLLPEKDFDLVIMNSLIQHFHGHNYLRKVIAKAIGLLKEQGCLFIGDIMDQNRKNLLVRELRQYKIREQNPRTKTDWSEELFVSPAFFEDLRWEMPEIEKIDVTEKTGTLDNELTRFRYDVLITVNKKADRRKTGKLPAKHKHQSDLTGLLRRQPGDEAAPAAVRSHHLAYVIYTSGTTGKPRGAMIQHRNVVRLLRNRRFQFDFHPGDTWTMFHAYNFDFSVWEMFGALLSGGKLVVVPRGVSRNTEDYLHLLAREQVTVMNQTPSVFYNLMEEELKKNTRELQARYVIFGGEALNPERLKPWKQAYPGVRLINMYGITETTVHVTYKELGDRDLESAASLIGTPIPTLCTYILDREMQLVPVGIPGELCVAGAGVCRGYLNSPELTAEKFKPAAIRPLSFTVGSSARDRNFRPTDRLYRSGDLARRLQDGQLEYLGRIDSQVKVRGYRVELGEIQALLQQQEQIKEALVTSRDQGENKYLCAYYTAETELEANLLKNHLARELPDYMIPSFFVHLPAIPVTANGKIDFRALPDPREHFDAGKNYEAPRNPLEDQLVRIWAGILALDHRKIGINDNFFALGGNSLTILKIKNKVKTELSYDVLLSTLFLYPTVKELADNIKEESILSRLECVVRLNRGNNPRNLFIIHPRHGMVYQYRELARLLEQDYNVYAVQARGIVRPSVLPPDLKTAAADYVHQILQVQEQGPFFLAGYCAGDIIGYSMVKLLEDLGHRVERFVMMDEEPWLSEETLDYYHTRRQMSQISKPWEKVSALFKKKDREALSPRDEYQQILRELETREEQVKKKHTGPLIPEDEEKLKKRYRMNYRKIMTKYAQASPYGGKIAGLIDAPLIDIKAEKSDEKKFDVKLLNRMTFGKFTLENVPGDHDTLFVEPAVSRIAEILRKM